MLVISKICCVFTPVKSALEWVGMCQIYYGTRHEAVCRVSLERTCSKRYLSEQSNFATLKLKTAVMQQKRLRG